MTKKEKEKIKEAIRLLMADEGGGEWDTAMEILVKLVYPGWENPLKETEPISILEILRHPEKYCKPMFHVKHSDEEGGAK